MRALKSNLNNKIVILIRIIYRGEHVADAFKMLPLPFYSDYY